MMTHPIGIDDLVVLNEFTPTLHARPLPCLRLGRVIELSKSDEGTPYAEVARLYSSSTKDSAKGLTGWLVPVAKLTLVDRSGGEPILLEALRQIELRAVRRPGETDNDRVRHLNQAHQIAGVALRGYKEWRSR